jgi:hypothetical protein
VLCDPNISGAVFGTFPRALRAPDLIVWKYLGNQGRIRRRRIPAEFGSAKSCSFYIWARLEDSDTAARADGPATGLARRLSPICAIAGTLKKGRQLREQNDTSKRGINAVLSQKTRCTGSSSPPAGAGGWRIRVIREIRGKWFVV